LDIPSWKQGEATIRLPGPLRCLRAQKGLIRSIFLIEMRMTDPVGAPGHETWDQPRRRRFSVGSA
jgi:hypothetical protein